MSKDVDPIYREVGQRIRKWRKVAGWTQHELAEQIDMLRSTLANIESGRQRTSLHLLQRIADVLGLGVADLLPTGRAIPEIQYPKRPDLEAEVRELKAQLTKAHGDLAALRRRVIRAVRDQPELESNTDALHTV